MMWDGLGFFGTSTAGIAGMRGEAFGWLTPLKDFKMVLFSVISMAITLYIIITEVYKLGT